MSISDRVRVKDVRVLSDKKYLLKSTTFEWRRNNGEWQTQVRGMSHASQPDDLPPPEGTP